MSYPLTGSIQRVWASSLKQLCSLAHTTPSVLLACSATFFLFLCLSFLFVTSSSVVSFPFLHSFEPGRCKTAVLHFSNLLSRPCVVLQSDRVNSQRIDTCWDANCWGATGELTPILRLPALTDLRLRQSCLPMHIDLIGESACACQAGAHVSRFRNPCEDSSVVSPGVAAHASAAPA